MINTDYSIFDKGGHFPTESHEYLLKAALFPRDEALVFFQKWLVKEKLDNLNPEEPGFLTRFLDPLDPACHRLLPLLVDNLGIQNHTYLKKLKGHQKNVWVKNQRIFLSVKELIKALNEYKIDHIVFKGISLSTHYYDRIEHRPMNDGDLLIPMKDKERVLELIANSKLGVDFNEADMQILDFVHATHLEGKGRMDIDLHWHVFSEYSQVSKSCDFIWEKSSEFDWDEIKTKKLNITHEFFVALVHGRDFDPVPPIRWVADCLMILRKDLDAVDWNEFIRLSKAFCYLPFIKKAIPYLEERFDAQIPQEVLTELEGLTPTRDETSYYKSISSNIREKGTLAMIYFGTKRRFIYYRMFLKERWPNVWVYLFNWYLTRWKREQKRIV
ncbi:nucleotidyltransferase family protein [Arcticibacterium luteifluviistationis]|uniref:Nucleotidyltransferase family protein n=1 Tax=Arcticibacterium luteifluviistationis TaxID=1784714 RepID=A0A2Z4GF36_9BACT|nr:nucleotidyltransferase family protein [Arcticibacterium luteifluviistationis]AWV99989.1 hypothetical protein DJ013_18185 [Arcticibacterium luteifluviistationis]